MPSKSSKGGKKKGSAASAAAAAAAAAPVSEEVSHGGVKKISERTCTGQLVSRPLSKDIKFEQFSLSYFGEDLIKDTTLELNFGRRYGLIGRNGSGKSTFLKALASRDVAIPDHIDVHLLHEEAAPSDMTPMEAVISFAKAEIERLEKEEEAILETEDGAENPILMDIYDRIEELDPPTFEKRAGELLYGLGFTKAFMEKKTRDLSGGWRMRVALAQALFVRPTLLLLDEPTNHLDLETCVWLEDCLRDYPKILVLVSHSQDFLNSVCTNIMHLTTKRTLTYYGGNYAQYVQTRKENEVNQMKQYVKQQEEIKHIKDFIASCGTYANLVRQAKSRQKILDKMEDAGLIEEVENEHIVSIVFPPCDRLAPPVLALKTVGFSYSGNPKDALYTGLDFGIDLDSRIVLVGPNGAGKSTLLKLLVGELEPTTGEIQRHSHLRIAKYNQHSAEILDFSLNAIEFMQREFAHFNLDVSDWRGRLGAYGISGKNQTKTVGTLSDGQKSLVVFCWLAQKSPQMLLFDEPTNHLDMEAIEGLAAAIKAFQGGMVLVSHDFRLLELTAKDIYVCDKKTVTHWDGDIGSYKAHLRKTMAKKSA